MGSRYSLEPVQKIAEEVEYQDKFEIGGQLVVVELVELGVLVIDDTESESGRVFIVRRMGAPEGELMKLVCPNDTFITVFETKIEHDVDKESDKLDSKEEDE
jgi:hypothetical protein